MVSWNENRSIVNNNENDANDLDKEHIDEEDIFLDINEISLPEPIEIKMLTFVREWTALSDDDNNNGSYFPIAWIL